MHVQATGLLETLKWEEVAAMVLLKRIDIQSNSVQRFLIFCRISISLLYSVVFVAGGPVSATISIAHLSSSSSLLG